MRIQSPYASLFSDNSTTDGVGPSGPPLRWLISCDESGTHGATHYGFGSLWMKEQRRGEFHADVKAIRDEHSFEDEIKWVKVKAPRLRFWCALVDYFFDTSGLCFQSVVIRRSLVNRTLHNGDFDLARRKHFAMLITSKMKMALRHRPDREQTFRVWVDPIASRYAKADEALHVIGNHILRKAAANDIRATLDARVQGSPIVGVHTHDSKDTPQIQLCDLLLGAVMDAWQRDATSKGKIELQAHIAKRLGWKDLHCDTWPRMRKFNIWHYKPKGCLREAIETRRSPHFT